MKQISYCHTMTFFGLLTTAAASSASSSASSSSRHSVLYYMSDSSAIASPASSSSSYLHSSSSTAPPSLSVILSLRIRCPFLVIVLFPLLSQPCSSSSYYLPLHVPLPPPLIIHFSIVLIPTSSSRIPMWMNHYARRDS